LYVIDKYLHVQERKTDYCVLYYSCSTHIQCNCHFSHDSLDWCKNYEICGTHSSDYAIFNHPRVNWLVSVSLALPVMLTTSASKLYSSKYSYIIITQARLKY